MKKLFFLSLALIMNFSLIANAQTKQNENKPKVEVYYFHATNRCPTCLAIEANAKKTFETYFVNELKTGKVKFIVINVDEEKNKKIAEKYEAAGSALFITKILNDKETKNDMTSFAFSYGRNNPDKFINELKDKINKMLK
ncbi:MAG: nitrophenyl compound nitroreductase subunit ArsF family protein [Bacteroidota bacterium]